MEVVGLVLAAGAGLRMGRPKALVSDESGPWLPRTVETLRGGGCASVHVVLGAAVEEPRELLRDARLDVSVVLADDWSAGQSASLRAGLSSLPPTAVAAVVMLVDLPDVGPSVVRRLLATSCSSGSLARASYAGRPGHPVLLGRDHWSAVAQTVSGDSGAREYLRTRDVRMVECADLASGVDRDR